MPEDITAATGAEPEVTPAGEGPDGTGSIEQETLAQIQASLEATRAQLQEQEAARLIAEARVTELDNAHKEAQREIVRKEREYKGLQSSTTQKMQELKVLQQMLSAQEITDAKLTKMERLVAELANTSLDPEKVQSITREIESEQQKRELDRYRQQAQAAQQQPTRPPLSRDYMIQLYNEYFREFDNVSIDDLTEDEWYGNGANDPVEWRQNVTQIFKDKSQKKRASEPQPVDPRAIAAEIRAAMQEEIAALRVADQEKQKESQQQIQQLQEELAESRRLSEEALNRSNGRDRSGTQIPGAGPRLAQQLADIPESWLSGTPEQRKAYRDALNNPKLRDQIINQSRGTT